MIPAERGLLLLCSQLGQEQVRPLTTAQLRLLRRRVLEAGVATGDPLRDVCVRDFMALGYNAEEANHIMALLSREPILDSYLQAARRRGIFPVTRLTSDYPKALREKRGGDAPPVLFCAGNRTLLQGNCVAVVGSRKLTAAGASFAAAAGRLAAKEGLTLVTGGAEGADVTALETCLAQGGNAVVFVPDDLRLRLSLAGEQCLVCSEQGYDLPFSAQRALSRNACIHMLASKTLVAQTGHGTGGTWSGSIENLKHGWSELYVNQDDSPGAAALLEQGATAVRALKTLAGLLPNQQSLF